MIGLIYGLAIIILVVIVTSMLFVTNLAYKKGFNDGKNSSNQTK